MILFPNYTKAHRTSSTGTYNTLLLKVWNNDLRKRGQVIRQTP